MLTSRTGLASSYCYRVRKQTAPREKPKALVISMIAEISYLVRSVFLAEIIDAHKRPVVLPQKIKLRLNSH